MKPEKPYLLTLPERGDERGNLVVAEGDGDIPFEIKRVFYIYGSDATVVRGCHANRISEFVIINVAGTSKVKTDDGHGNVQIFELDKPREGVYIPAMVWKDMYDFSPDSVMLVICSTHYDGSEYLRDYEEFRKEVQGT